MDEIIIGVTRMLGVASESKRGCDTEVERIRARVCVCVCVVINTPAPASVNLNLYSSCYEQFNNHTNTITTRLHFYMRFVLSNLLSSHRILAPLLFCR